MEELLVQSLGARIWKCTWRRSQTRSLFPPPPPPITTIPALKCSLEEICTAAVGIWHAQLMPRAAMYLQVDPREAQLAKATRCQLSGQMLCPPVAADELGHLFNKDAVVGALLAKTLPPDLAHITRCVASGVASPPACLWLASPAALSRTALF